MPILLSKKIYIIFRDQTGLINWCMHVPLGSDGRWAGRQAAGLLYAKKQKMLQIIRQVANHVLR